MRTIRRLELSSAEMGNCKALVTVFVGRSRARLDHLTSYVFWRKGFASDPPKACLAAFRATAWYLGDPRPRGLHCFR